MNTHLYLTYIKTPAFRIVYNNNLPSIMPDMLCLTITILYLGLIIGLQMQQNTIVKIATSLINQTKNTVKGLTIYGIYITVIETYHFCCTPKDMSNLISGVSL